MRLVAIVCVVTVTFTGAAQAQPDRIDSITMPQDTALVDFWTERRQQDAQPIPLPVLDRSALGPDSQPPSAGLRPSTPNELARASGDVRTRPLFWAGKLFSTIDENTVGFCSAQLVAPDIVVTAAHCVRNDKTGAWNQRTIYRHQFDRGKGRIFTTECTAAYNGWVSPDRSRFQWDYAMIKLRGTWDQGHFGLEYGWRGKYNRAAKVGYPMGIEGGQVIQVEHGPLLPGWGQIVAGINHGNPQNTGGSSGGAWVANYDPNATDPRSNVIISVESHYINNEPRTSYGPYWDQKMVQLLNHAKRGCK